MASQRRTEGLTDFEWKQLQKSVGFYQILASSNNAPAVIGAGGDRHNVPPMSQKRRLPQGMSMRPNILKLAETVVTDGIYERSTNPGVVLQRDNHLRITVPPENKVHLDTRHLVAQPERMPVASLHRLRAPRAVHEDTHLFTRRANPGHVIGQRLPQADPGPKLASRAVPRILGV